jgi:hypothetical protein
MNTFCSFSFIFPKERAFSPIKSTHRGINPSIPAFLPTAISIPKILRFWHRDCRSLSPLLAYPASLSSSKIIGFFRNEKTEVKRSATVIF